MDFMLLSRKKKRRKDMGNDPGAKDLLGHRVLLTVLMSQP